LKHVKAFKRAPSLEVSKIRSPRLRMLALFSPGGLKEAFRSLTSPAQNLELPTGAPTYSTADLTHTVQLLGEYGVRFLGPDEVAERLPLYLKSLLNNSH
jgi:hypothetical protein